MLVTSGLRHDCHHYEDSNRGTNNLSPWFLLAQNLIEFDERLVQTSLKLVLSSDIFVQKAAITFQN